MTKLLVTVLTTLVLILAIGGIYLWGARAYNQNQSVVELEEFKIPNIKSGGNLMFKAPKGTNKVEILHSNYAYVTGNFLHQSLFDKIYNIWKIPISTLKYEQGRSNFKFRLNNEFEVGPERAVIVNPSGDWESPPNEIPTIQYPHKTSKTLYIKDQSATSIGISNLYEDPNQIIPLYYNKVNNLWEVKNLELGEGYYKFKIVKDGKIDNGPDRVIIAKKGKIIRPDPSFEGTFDALKLDPEMGVIAAPPGDWEKSPNEIPTIQYPHKTSKTLYIKDQSATSIGISNLYGDPNQIIPLSYNKINNLWEVKNLELDKGYYKFKIVKDRKIDNGPDRVIIAKKGRITRPDPLFATIISSEGTFDTLRVKAPATTFLALKGSFDDFETQYPLSFNEEDKTFSFSLSDLNLAEGIYDLEFISSEGSEPTGKNPLYINSEGKLYFPWFDNLDLLVPNSPSKSIRVQDCQLRSLNITFSKDGWGKSYPMLLKDGVWEVTLEGLKPGMYEFKFQPNSVWRWEKRSNRVIIIERDGLISYPDTINPKIISISKDELKVKTSEFITLSLRDSKDWEKDIPGVYNSESNLWEFNLSELGVDIAKSGRLIFKFLINGNFEEGPNRIMTINKDNKVSVGRLTQKEGREKDATSFPTTKNKYFGEIRKISPNINLSLKGSENWFEDMAIYHLWVKSFRDSKSGTLSGDTIGDLRGIREAIQGNYFSQLGVNTLWLSPIFSAKGEENPSINMHGYDILDDYRININFGDLAEFKSLLKDAHNKNLRIILDVVPNHVSDMHPWFLASKNPEHPEHEIYKDYFIWTDTPTKGWENKGIWGNASQNFSSERNQYYYSIFGPTLPDLNYRNPQVKKALIDNLIYWLNMGVDGVRVGAIGHVFDGDPNKEISKRNHPENIVLFQNIVATLNQYQSEGYAKLLLGENSTWELKDITKYGKEKNGVGSHASINFAFARGVKSALESGSRTLLVNHLKKSQPRNILYPRFISNHDSAYSRPATAYGVEGAKVAYVLNSMTPGPYIMYYGEEIGLEGENSISENLRAPFDWEDYGDQLEKETSILNFYRKMKSIREGFKTNITWDNMEILDPVKYNRSSLVVLYPGIKKSLLIIYNFGKEGLDLEIVPPTNLTTKREITMVLNTASGQTTNKLKVPNQWNSDSTLDIKSIGAQSAIILSLENN